MNIKKQVKLTCLTRDCHGLITSSDLVQLILSFGSGVQPRPFVLRPEMGLVYQPLMTSMDMGWENQSAQSKTNPVLYCPPQTPHGIHEN
jgi:hypothetical protein